MSKFPVDLGMLPILSTPLPVDAESLAAMGAKSFFESHHTSASRADIDDYISNTYTRERFSSEIEDPRNVFRIAKVGDRIAGFSKIIPDAYNPQLQRERSCKMERLYVLEEFFHLKIGQLLFDECIRTATELNQSGIWLNVWTGNPRAIRFYTKQGFTIAGETMFRISAAHSNPNYLMWKENG